MLRHSFSGLRFLQLAFAAFGFASLAGCRLDASAARKQAEAYADSAGSQVLGCRESLWASLDCDLPGYRRIECDAAGCLESMRRCER